MACTNSTEVKPESFESESAGLLNLDISNCACRMFGRFRLFPSLGSGIHARKCEIPANMDTTITL